METVDVLWNWFVFKMKAYKYIVKVTKFEVPLAYRFSTAEGRTSLWVMYISISLFVGQCFAIVRLKKMQTLKISRKCLQIDYFSGHAKKS